MGHGRPITHPELSTVALPPVEARENEGADHVLRLRANATVSVATERDEPRILREVRGVFIPLRRLQEQSFGAVEGVRFRARPKREVHEVEHPRRPIDLDVAALFSCFRQRGGETNEEIRRGFLLWDDHLLVREFRYPFRDARLEVTVSDGS